MTHDFTYFFKSDFRELVLELERIKKRSKEDPGTAGDDSEGSWKNFLMNWIPEYYPIITKGRMLNTENVASAQFDIFVLNPAYPKKAIEKKYFISSSVELAFEIKTTLRKRDLEEFFERCVYTKRLISYTESSIFEEFFSPNYIGLIAFNSEIKSNELLNLIYELDKKYVHHPSEMPDGLLIADIGSFLPYKFATIFDAPWFKKYTIDSIHEHISVSPIQTGYYPSYNNDQEYTGISTLIMSLMRRLGFKDINVRSLLLYYENIGLQPPTGASSRGWNYDIFSDSVKSIFSTPEALQKKWKPWGFWNNGYF